MEQRFNCNNDQKSRQPDTVEAKMCRAGGPSEVPSMQQDAVRTTAKHAAMPAPPLSDFQPRMLASELITAIQRCAIGDKEQLQSASELGAIFVSELHQLLVNRPNLQPQTFRQILPAVQYFLNRSLMVSAADTGDALRNANRLLAAATGFVALGMFRPLVPAS